jgi:ATP-dependent RNA helicase RhlE
VIPVDRDRKRELLSHLITSGRIDQALVFTRTKHGANRLAEQLGKDDINAAAIHGNKSQAQRVRALTDFKAGRVAILVATDIAARGLDIELLPHVVNYELPMVAEDYVHRIGRTGRAGKDGEAISLVCVDERSILQDIQALLRRPISTETIQGFEPNRNVRPEPIRLRSTPAERAERLAARGGQPSSGRGGHSSAGRGQSGAGRGPGRPGNGRHGGRPSGDQPHGSPMTHGSPAAHGPASGKNRRRRPDRKPSTFTPGTGFGNAAPGNGRSMPGERIRRLESR